MIEWWFASLSWLYTGEDVVALTHPDLLRINLEALSNIFKAPL